MTKRIENVSLLGLKFWQYWNLFFCTHTPHQTVFSVSACPVSTHSMVSIALNTNILGQAKL